MSAEGDIHGALMGRVETLTGFDVVYPTRGEREPQGEHVKVYHIPNDNRRLFLASGPYGRQGILQLSLFSPLGANEIIYRDRAGTIAEHFPADLTMTHNGLTLRVQRTDVGQGRSDGQHWLTPVSVYYQGFA